MAKNIQKYDSIINHSKIKIKIKIIMKCYFTPIRLIKISKTDNTSVDKDMQKMEFARTTAENI